MTAGPVPMLGWLAVYGLACLLLPQQWNLTFPTLVSLYLPLYFCRRRPRMAAAGALSLSLLVASLLVEVYRPSSLNLDVAYALSLSSLILTLVTVPLAALLATGWHSGFLLTLALGAAAWNLDRPVPALSLVVTAAALRRLQKSIPRKELPDQAIPTNPAAFQHLLEAAQGA